MAESYIHWTCRVFQTGISELGLGMLLGLPKDSFHPRDPALTQAGQDSGWARSPALILEAAINYSLEKLCSGAQHTGLALKYTVASIG